MKDPRFAEHLAMFVEVARQGSFSAAARRRAVTPSAVVRQVDALEDSLGVRLLLRSTRALSLTEAGQRLLIRGQRLLDDLDDVRSEIGAFDGAVAGVLRVACFPTFGKRYVLPVLAELMGTHPVSIARPRPQHRPPPRLGRRGALRPRSASRLEPAGAAPPDPPDEQVGG